jgi:hypothetical protein
LINTTITTVEYSINFIFFLSFRNLKHETWKVGNAIKNRKLQHVRAEIRSLSVHCKEIKLFSIYWSLDNLYLDPSTEFPLVHYCRGALSSWSKINSRELPST